MNYLDPKPLAVAPSAGVESRDAVTRDLSRILETGADIHRCLAARALGRIGGDSAVPALTGALLDPDEDVRTDSAEALAKIGSPETCTVLLENLIGDPCTDVKLAAIRALARMRYDEASPWLLKMARGRDSDIVWDDEEFFHTEWDGWVDIQLAAITALADLGNEDIVPEIVRLLDDEEEQDFSETAFKALARLGATGIAALINFLDSQDERHRRRAASVLAGLSEPAAETATSRALNDPSINVRLAAASALAAASPSDARLAPLFDDPDSRVRTETVRLCGDGHLEQISGRLEDGSPEVRAAALNRLAEFPGFPLSPGGVDAAVGCLDDAAPEVAGAACRTVAVHAPATGVDKFVELLSDDGRPRVVRLGAIGALERIGGSQAVMALADVLGDGDRQVRVESLAALSRLAQAAEEWPNEPGAVLLAAIEGTAVAAPEPADPVPEPEPEKEPTDDDDVEETSDDTAFPTSTLQSILGENAPQESLAIGLGSETRGLTQDDIHYLELAARAPEGKRVKVVPNVHPHEDVPRLAARILGDLAQEDVAVTLTWVLDGADKEARRAAADSLARIAGALGTLPTVSVAGLTGLIADGDSELRRCAVRALGAAGISEAVTSISRCLKDEDSNVRAEAVRALAALGASSSYAERMLADADPGVRLTAAQAVAAEGGDDAVSRLVDFAFSFEGYHRREVGRLLCGLDTAAANKQFVDFLGDQTKERFWPVAIEALEELNCAGRA